MTIARAIIRPGKWTNRDETWPRVDLTYVAPITDAYFDWAADQLALGSLTQWASLNNGVPLLADGGAPTVVNSGGGKAVQFDGEANRMRVQTPAVPANHCVVAVFRLTDPKPGNAVVFGYANSQGGSVVVSGDGSTLTGYINGTYLTPSPNIAPDTSWHVMMLNSDGANSAFRIDDQERAASANSQQRPGLTLGYGQNADTTRTAIEYKRAVIMPPLNPTERAALFSKLKLAYGI